MYHFWIRTVNPQGRYSVWSNPVSERTLDIIPPVPPTAIRVASRTSLQAYNTENSTNLATGEPNQLILEFLRIFNDLNNPAPGPAQTGYDVTGGLARWLASPSLRTTYMTFFDELLPNRLYYVRVSTILTVTRGDSPTGIVRAYSYRMQIAITDEFLDPIEIILPSLQPYIETPGQMRRAESEWSEVFWFRSGASDDEYDGDVNADLFPLPDRDWEITYDRDTSTLTFRFRTNQIDETGARDHNVDQRFISRLVQQRVFTYRLNMSTYNYQPVANAVVEVPYSILQAFYERQIAMEITMDNVVVSFTPGSLATPEALALAGVGPDTTARLMIYSGTPGAPALNLGDSYASVPRQIAAQVVTPARTINFDNFAQPLELTFRLEHQAMLMEHNVALFTTTPITQGWQRMDASHSPITGDLTINAYRVGNFAAIAQAGPAQIMPQHPSRDAFLRVTSAITITDMPAFNPNEAVTGNVFNNMVAAVANGRNTVAVYSAVSRADTTSLTRARLFVPGDVVSREAAIASLVTVYERRTGAAVRPADGSAPPDLASASAANHLALIKASYLGFFTGNARPTEALTMGDFMTMLDIIILDAR
jgi:hypothetical protein